jgi:hypothetical protein
MRPARRCEASWRRMPVTDFGLHCPYLTVQGTGEGEGGRVEVSSAKSV